MPFSTTTLVRFTAKLSRCLSLALLPALASEAHAIGQPQRKQDVRSAEPGVSSKATALPYLAALGPLPLRFAHPGPEPTAEPPAPPEPKVITPKADPAATDEKSSKPVAELPAVVTPPEAKPAQPDHITTPISEFDEPTPQPALPILPDDTKRELRAEDVLPFFIYPTSGSNHGNNGVRVIAPLGIDQPQPIVPPPSSATYQEK
ncbi:MAG: hypothetical protein QM760_02265 [Nibricoccus sp.]